jgi:tellurite resistance protein TehA-like permease
MKKSLIITSLASVVFMFDAQAQNRGFDHEAMRIVAVIFVMVLIAVFILTFLRYILDNRIKHRIIEKGIAQDLVSSLLANNKKDDKLQTLKWVCLLAATGAGLLLVYYTLPIDIHSFAIMCFSISLGYLGYYFIMKQAQK